MSNTQQKFKSGKAHGEGQGQAEQWIDSARGVASDTAQSAQENKEQAAGFLQQTGEQVMQMAHGAADAVKNAVGMGGSDSTGAGGTTTRSTTTTTSTKR